MAVALAVTISARDGAAERVAAGLLVLQEASRREPGCRSWTAHRSTEHPERFFLYELYEDEAALEAHRASAHFRRYLETIGPLIDRDPVRYEPLQAT